MNRPNEQRRVERKVAILGYKGVGKTAIATRLVQRRFLTGYEPTIIGTFHKTINIQNVQFRVEIVDTAGQDDYTRIPNEAAVGVHGYILVYDVASKPSFDQIRNIHDVLIDKIGAENVASVLVANKTDVGTPKVPSELGRRLAEQWGCPFLETSARTDQNIDEVFTTLIHRIEAESSLLAPPKSQKEKSCVIL